MQEIGMYVDVKGRGINDTAKSLDGLAKSADKAEHSTLTAGLTAKDYQNKLRGLEATARAFGHSQEAIANATMKVTSTAHQLISADGKLLAETKRLTSANKELEASAKKTGTAMGAMIDLAAGVFTVSMVKNVIDMADGYTQMASRIRNSTDSFFEYQQVQERLKETAKTTYRSLGEAQEGFLAFSESMKALGYSTNEALDLTDSLSFSFTANAARADQAQAANDALAKSMARGRVDANAWMSILMAADNVAGQIAKTMNVTEAEVRSLGANGKLALDDLVKGLIAARSENKGLADAMSSSADDGWQNLVTGITAYLGELNIATGATNMWAQALSFVGSNIAVIAPILAGLAFVALPAMMSAATGAISSMVGTSLAATALSAVLTGLSSPIATAVAGFRALSVAMMANPIGLVVAGLIGAYAVIDRLIDKFGFLGDSFVNMGDVFSGTMDYIKSGMSAVGDFISDKWFGLTVDILGCNDLLSLSFDDAMGFILDVSLAVPNQIIGAFVTAYELIANTWSAAPEFFDNLGANIAGLFIGRIEGMVNASIGLLNKLTSAINGISGLNIGQVGNVDLKSKFGISQNNFGAKFGEQQAKTIGSNFGKKFIQNAAKSISNGASSLYQGSGLQSAINKRAHKRITDEAAGIGGMSTGGSRPAGAQAGGTGGSKGKSPKSGGRSESEKIADSYLKEFTQMHDVLSSLKQEYEDIDKYGFKSQYSALRDFNAELSKQDGKYAKFSETQKTQLAGIAKQIDLQKELNAIQGFRSEQSKALDDMKFELELTGLTAKAVEQLRFERDLEAKAKAIGAGMSEEGLAKLREEIELIKQRRGELEAEKAVLGGDWAGGIRDGLIDFVESAGTLREQFSSATASTMNTLGDAIGGMVTGARTSFRDLTASIMADLAKIAMRMAMMNLLSGAMGTYTNAQFGGGMGPQDGMGGNIANLFQANGGAWSGGVQMFAAGGAFTNSVVNSPTAFAHAGGLGVMGEAGPEAIMPLTRGANGKLGVVAHGVGSSGAGNVVININIESGANVDEAMIAQLEARLYKTIDTVSKANTNKIIQRQMMDGGVFSKMK